MLIVCNSVLYMHEINDIHSNTTVGNIQIYSTYIIYYNTNNNKLYLQLEQNFFYYQSNPHSFKKMQLHNHL